MHNPSAVESDSSSRQGHHCTLREAVETAIAVTLVGHLIVCFLIVLIIAFLAHDHSRWLGVLIAAAFAIAIPVVIIPVAIVIGFLAHWFFSESSQSVPAVVCVLAALFEASLLGWMIYLAVMLYR